MKYLEWRKPRIIIKEFCLIILGLTLLAYVDLIVVDAIITSITTNYAIPWSAFEIVIFYRKVFVWHVAFVPLSIGMFIWGGIASNSWRLALSGITMFLAGWEDMLYFFLQPKWLPHELPWLDSVAYVSWSRIFTGTAHVTATGLVISAAASGIVVLFLILFTWSRLCFWKKDKNQ